MEMTKNENTIDLTYLKQLSNGDVDFVREMIVVFMEQTPEGIGQMEKHLQDKNWKMLRAVVHKMKPSFSFVGLKELNLTINSIEEYAEKETHLDLIPELIAKLKSGCAQAMVELEEAKKLFQ